MENDVLPGTERREARAHFFLRSGRPETNVDAWGYYASSALRDAAEANCVVSCALTDADHACNPTEERGTPSISTDGRATSDKANVAVLRCAQQHQIVTGYDRTATRQKSGQIRIRLIHNVIDIGRNA